MLGVGLLRMGGAGGFGLCVCMRGRTQYLEGDADAALVPQL